MQLPSDKHSSWCLTGLWSLSAGAAADQDLTSGDRTGAVGTSFYISPGQHPLFHTLPCRKGDPIPRAALLVACVLRDLENLLIMM